jgi:hypothetical protein
MLNVRKGTLHSLAQADMVGYQQPGIVAGMIVNIDSNGYVNAGAQPTNSVTSGGSVGVRGFAINTSAQPTTNVAIQQALPQYSYSGDGDVLDSNKISVYTLEGNSIIETDQVDPADNGGVAAINSSVYPVGIALYSSLNANALGTVTKTANGTAIGWVVGIRYLQNTSAFPSGVSATQSYTSSTETAAYLAEGAPTGTGNGQPVYTPSTKSSTYKFQENVPVLAIKLAATA